LLAKAIVEWRMRRETRMLAVALPPERQR